MVGWSEVRLRRTSNTDKRTHASMGLKIALSTVWGPKSRSGNSSWEMGVVDEVDPRIEHDITPKQNDDANTNEMAAKG